MQEQTKTWDWYGLATMPLVNLGDDYSWIVTLLAAFVHVPSCTPCFIWVEPHLIAWSKTQVLSQDFAN